MQRYFCNKKGDHEFFLDEKDIHHILHVMRMKSNDEIEVVYHQELYLCVLEIKEAVHIYIKEKKMEEPVHSYQTYLILPFLKEEKIDFILQKATELGVTGFYFMPMQHCMVKLDEKKKEKKLERWNRICKEASEQSKRLDIPSIQFLSNSKDLQNLEGLKLVCNPKETEHNLRFFLQKEIIYDKLYIVIGPEGGLSNEELGQLKRMDFQFVTLGSRILRVETVPLFLLSVIHYETMEI